jgi:hypothetical protein
MAAQKLKLAEQSKAAVRPDALPIVRDSLAEADRLPRINMLRVEPPGFAVDAS